MLCSIRGEPKPGSNWLDRLRSSKGFPTGDHLDLDHFLSDSPLSNPSNSESTHSPQQPALTPTQTPEISRQNEDKENENENENENELFSIVTNVLSELFNFGNPNDNPKLSVRKIPRKQTNPRFCVIQNNVEESVRKDENSPEVRVNYDEERKEENVDVEEEEEEEEEEMVGYSRSEVTVIDTSWGQWKAEKVVYRRRNVWKVREKKGKGRSGGRKKKKRKGSDGNGNGNKKKARVLGSEEAEGGSGGECVMPLNEGQNPQNDKREEVCKETLDDRSQVPKKRFPLSRSPRKSGKRGSSVILIEGIPTSKKSGAKLPKNNSKDTQRQYKAS